MTKTLLTTALLLTILPASAAKITVSAAASLTDAFRDVATAYEQRHPEDNIALNFAGSGALLQQIVNGAPVDVFAPADQLRMDKAAAADLINPATRKDFARNRLVAIVPADNQATFADLAAFVTAPARLAIANPDFVPVGRYSKNALQQAGLWTQAAAKSVPAQNVRQVLDYVARGEVDGGFVYATDAALRPQQVRVVLPVALNEPLTYPIAVLRASHASESAQRFVDFVTGADGQAILHRYGFQSPVSEARQ